MRDIVSFLREQEPFAGLPDAEVEQIAGQVEVEYFAAGDVIFGQGESPPERVRIIVSGAVELLDRGRPLDLLGEGELFGHPSMLAGLPTGFAARAHEDTLCYRLHPSCLSTCCRAHKAPGYVARSLPARRWRTERAAPTDSGDPVDP